MEGERIYRPGCLVLVFGLMFTVIPLIFIVPGIYGLITGTPIPFSSEEGPTRPGTTGELLLIVLFPLIHLTIGVSVMLHWLHSRVIVSEQGVVGKDWLGRVSFDAGWRDLTAYQVKSDGDGSDSYYIFAGDRKLSLLDKRCNDQIIEELKVRVPHIKRLE